MGPTYEQTRARMPNKKGRHSSGRLAELGGGLSSGRQQAARRVGRRPRGRRSWWSLANLLPNYYLSVQAESRIATCFIVCIKIYLLLYDFVSLPVYYIVFKLVNLRGGSARATLGSGRQTGRSNEKKENCAESAACSTLSELFAHSIQTHWPKSCLGYRAVVTCPVLAPNELGEQVLQERSFRSDYTWFTYGQVGQRVQDLASGLYQQAIYPKARALFLASASLEWLCAAQACFQLALQVVLAPDIGDAKILGRILEETQSECLFVSCDRLATLCKLLDQFEHRGQQCARLNGVCKCFALRKIIIIDWPFRVDFNEPTFLQLGETLHDLQAQSNSIEVLSMGQLEECGFEVPIELGCSQVLAQGEFVGSSHNLNSKRPTTIMDDEVIGAKPFGEHQSKLSAWLASSSAAPSQVRARKQGGRASPEVAPPPQGPGAEDLALISYTFGPLGQLKAVVLTHSQITKRCTSGHLLSEARLSGKDVHCAVLQLDCLLELMVQLSLFGRGASIGYSCNLATLFYDGRELFARDKSDLQALEPSFLLVRPYILERLRISLQNYLQTRMSPLIGFVMRNALFDYKKHWAERGQATPIVDQLFCSRLKRLFGPKIKFILCNGPADCSETRDFVAFMLNLPLVELYGPDEAVASLLAVSSPKRRRSHPSARRPASSLWWPSASAQIKLEDWHDFRLSDRPFARGRLLIGGDVLCRGHFSGHLREQQSRGGTSVQKVCSSSIAAGWFKTDDVVRALPNGGLEIISAISDLIKMHDGQFVSLSQIEHILRNSRFVDNVCSICGDDRSFVINLVVPNLRRLALKSPGEANLKQAIGGHSVARSSGRDEPVELVDVEFRREVCNDRLLSEFVAKHLGDLLMSSALASIQNKFLLVPEIWTPDSELVTPAFEPKRLAIQKFYAADIESIVRAALSSNNSRRLSARRYQMRKSSSSARRLN